MKSRKRVLLGLMILAVIMISISFVSAGFWSDLFKIGKGGEGLEGELASEKVNVSVSMQNIGPVIIYVSLVNDGVSTLGVVDPVENTVKQVSFSFFAYDPNGPDNLEDTAMARFEHPSGDKYSSELRENLSCIDMGDVTLGDEFGSLKGYYAGNYSCTIGIWYWDIALEDWIVNASIKDVEGLYAENSSTTFYIKDLGAIKVAPSQIGWTNISLDSKNTSANVPAENASIIVNNTGNRVLTAQPLEPYILLKGTNLTGIGLHPEDQLPAERFKTSPDESSCHINSTRLSEIDEQVQSASLDRGDLSIGDRRSQRDLYFCLEDLPAIHGDQQYSTRDVGPWQLSPEWV